MLLCNSVLKHGPPRLACGTVVVGVSFSVNFNLSVIKARITPKSFFHLNKSLHLFETHCAFLPLFNPNIDLLQAVKVSKSGHHRSQDGAIKGYESIPCLTSQTSLHACLQRLNNTICKSVFHIKQGIDPGM